MNFINILRLFILASPFIDLFVSFCTRYQIIPPVIGTAIRGVFLVFVVYFALTRVKRKDKYRVLKWVAVIVGICVLTVCSVVLSDGLVSLSEIPVLALKYWYFPVITICMIYIFKNTPAGHSKAGHSVNVQMISDAIYHAGIIYSLLIIVPTFLGVNYEAYDVGDMGGSIGLLYAKNEKGALLALIFPFAFGKILERRGKMVPNIIGSVIILVACFMTGTKAPLLAIAISTVLMIFAWRTKRNNFGMVKKIMFVASAATIFVVAIIHSTALDNLQARSDYLQCEPASYNETTCLLLSNRDAFFINRADAWSDTPVYEKLFGMSEQSMYGYDTKPLVEMDFADIFFMFGLIGLLMYLYFMIKTIGVAWRMWHISKKSKFNNNELDPYLTSFISAMPVALLAGHILSAPAVSIMLALCVAIPTLPNYNVEVRRA